MKFKIKYADQIVGFFSLVAIASLIVLIFAIGAKKSWFTKKNYYFTVFDSGSGIYVGMDLMYKGFSIGKVESVDLVGEFVKVDYYVLEDYFDYVKEYSIVELSVSPIGLGSSFTLFPGTGSTTIPSGREIFRKDSMPGEEGQDAGRGRTENGARKDVFRPSGSEKSDKCLLFHALNRNFVSPTFKTNPTNHDTMKVINLSEQNSVINQYLAEIRDKSYQRNRALFRQNIRRIGEAMAYEISKTLAYRPKKVVTPLGTAEVMLAKDDLLLATVLRAGLPFHEGFLHVFDKAANGFVSAYRMYTNREHTEVGIHTEYMAAPSCKGKTLVIVDPMLATGGSMAASYEALVKTGTPRQVHIACVIATPEGLDVLRQTLPEDATVWCTAIDPGMNANKYIVPGFGDAGDLCFGEKL